MLAGEGLVVCTEDKGVPWTASRLEACPAQIRLLSMGYSLAIRHEWSLQAVFEVSTGGHAHDARYFGTQCGRAHPLSIVVSKTPSGNSTRRISSCGQRSSQRFKCRCCPCASAMPVDMADTPGAKRQVLQVSLSDCAGLLDTPAARAHPKGRDCYGHFEWVRKQTTG